ncbi:Protein piccolo [Labeo rohita]|uniref:Protein piccolo n=1 Tax=Labeo rohita TaxID=84645 RepID=A0ABQ8L626_LABRO|nr:Protein piccolo [Labeo rohita]
MEEWAKIPAAVCVNLVKNYRKRLNSIIISEAVPVVSPSCPVVYCIPAVVSPIPLSQLRFAAAISGSAKPVPGTLDFDQRKSTLRRTARSTEGGLDLTAVRRRNRLKWANAHIQWHLALWRGVLFTDESQFLLYRGDPCWSFAGLYWSFAGLCWSLTSNMTSINQLRTSISQLRTSLNQHQNIPNQHPSIKTYLPAYAVFFTRMADSVYGVVWMSPSPYHSLTVTSHPGLHLPVSIALIASASVTNQRRYKCPGPSPRRSRIVPPAFSDFHSRLSDYSLGLPVIYLSAPVSTLPLALGSIHTFDESRYRILRHPKIQWLSEYRPTMDPASRLFRLRQGNQPIEDYVIDFCELFYLVTFNDVALKDIFRHGLNEPISSYLTGGKIYWSLEQYIDYVLLLSGSSFTVGIADEEPCNPTRPLTLSLQNLKPAHAMSAASKPAHAMPAAPGPAHAMPAAPGPAHVMPAAPGPAHAMSAKPAPALVTSAKPEPALVTSAKPVPAFVTSAPESASVTAALPESAPVTAALPESAAVTAALPESAPISATLPELVHKMAAIPKTVHKMAAPSESPAKMAAMPEPPHAMVILPESRPVMSAIPQASQVMADPLESSQSWTFSANQVTDDLHEPSKVTAVVPESSQVTADLHEPSQVTAGLHEPSQVTADFPESSQVTVDLPVSSKVTVDLPVSSQVMADLPKSSHGRPP